MEAISTPARTYSQPPQGALPDHCPSCNVYLGHFLQRATESDVAADVTSNDLFIPGDEMVSISPPPMPPLPELLGVMEKMQERIANTPPSKPKPVGAQPKIESLNGFAGSEVFDHPAIAGKITLFVLLFGQDYRLHRRCLHSLASTTGLKRLLIRPICHEVSAQTMQLLAELPLDHIYTGTKKRYKFESMRLAFHDSARQLDTKWNVWLDDIAWCKRSDWLVALAQTIVNQDPAEKVGAIGNKFCHVLSSGPRRDPRVWFRNAKWFGGKNFFNKHGVPAPNGDCVHYLSPNFFALSTEAIKVCDIPDGRLKQSGGGVAIGEQLHQHGYKLKLFNSDQVYVNAEQSARARGQRDIYPWQ